MENQQKADLSKLSNLVDNELVNKTLCDKLYARVCTVDTSVFVSSQQYNTDKLGIEKNIDDAQRKIPNTGGLVKKSECNTEITELESKTPCITGLSTTSALNAG